MTSSVTHLPQHDPLTEQRLEYLTQVRNLHNGKRTLGFVACLAGALLLIWGRIRPDAAPSFALPAGLTIVAGGWLLFAYVIVMRTRYVRSHPFDPKR